MLNREFLSIAGLSSTEFVRWVGADKAELTPFEARLFKEAEAAEIITGGDNSPYSAEELRQLIDIGVMAENHGLDTKGDIERVGAIESAAYELTDWQCANAPEVIDLVLDVLKAAAKNARTKERREELWGLIERLNDVGAAVDKLEKALNS